MKQEDRASRFPGEKGKQFRASGKGPPPVVSAATQREPASASCLPLRAASPAQPSQARPLTLPSQPCCCCCWSSASCSRGRAQPPPPPLPPALSASPPLLPLTSLAHSQASPPLSQNLAPAAKWGRARDSPGKRGGEWGAECFTAAPLFGLKASFFHVESRKLLRGRHEAPE